MEAPPPPSRTPLSPRNHLGLIASLIVLATPSAHSTTDYLLAEGPATGSLELEETSYDGFGTDNGFGSRFSGVFSKEGGPLRRQLRKTFPTLHEMFAGAEISLRPRTYYRYVRKPGGAKQEAFATGGALEFQSGWWQDTLQFGFAGYATQELYGPSGRGGSGLLSPGQDSISVLGELWAKAQWEDLSLQVGRSDINMPYINRNDSRMIPQTFEFAALFYKPCDELQMGIGHITQIKERDSDEFISMSKKAGVMGPSRGVTTAGLRWEHQNSLELVIFNHYGWDTYNTFYTELQWGAPGLYLPVDWRIALQFTDQRSVGDELLGEVDTQQLGAKIATSWNGFLVSLSATKTSNDGTVGVRNDWGGSPSYLSSMVSDFDRPGEFAGRLSVQTDLHRLTEGLSAALSVATGETDHGPDQRSQEELDLTLDYNSPHLDGLWLRVRGAWHDRGGENTEDYRMILNYERSF